MMSNCDDNKPGEAQPRKVAHYADHRQIRMMFLEQAPGRTPNAIHRTEQLAHLSGACRGHSTSLPRLQSFPSVKPRGSQAEFLASAGQLWTFDKQGMGKQGWLAGQYQHNRKSRFTPETGYCIPRNFMPIRGRYADFQVGLDV